MIDLSSADRAQIRAVLDRYLSALDFGDYAALTECFTADAVLSYDTRPYRFVGGEQLARWVQSAHQAHHACATHILGSVEITPSATTAAARSLVVANLAKSTRDGFAVTVRGIRYDDELRRAPQGWQISRRTHSPLWQFDATGQQLDDIGAVSDRSASGR